MTRTRPFRRSWLLVVALVGSIISWKRVADPSSTRAVEQNGHLSSRSSARGSMVAPHWVHDTAIYALDLS